MELVLGIDIGTTSVKVALVDKATKNVVRTKSRETHANTHSDLDSIGNEQDPTKILTALQICVSGLPKDELLKVSLFTYLQNVYTAKRILIKSFVITGYC